MSTIGVAYHDEDIHNIIRKPTEAIIKSPRYKSKKIISETKIKTTGHDTFGYARYHVDPPCNYLKKGKRSVYEPQPIDKKEFRCTLKTNRPPVPKWKFECPKGRAKDFIRENIKWADSLQPTEHCPRRVDSPRGNVQDLSHLVEMIKIREREEYGKVPKYLCGRKQKIQSEKVKEIKDLEFGKENEKFVMLDQEARAKLLEGLKENWAELSRQFLGLPVMCDTWPKIKRKMWLEKEIEQIEKDVRLVESHPHIYFESSQLPMLEKKMEKNAKAG